MINKFNLTIIVLLTILTLSFTPTAFANHEDFLFDRANQILISYFDLRQRSSQVQVTNVSSTETATIHVQIFADTFECEDRDFTDSLTPNETHVYDISNLISANGNPINFAIPDGSHGFVAITSAINNNPASTIIGNFRIIDDVGYEYRVNSAGATIFQGPPDPNPTTPLRVVSRFSTHWGANQADVVGADFFDQSTLADGTLDLSIEISDSLPLFVFDDEETALSCGEAIFGCDETPGEDGELPEFTAEFINQGINDTFPNSRGGGVLCSGDFNSEGFIELQDTNDNLLIVTFFGLNDGVSRGSMDRSKAPELSADD